MSLVRRKTAAPRFARPRLYQQLAVHITDFIEAQGLSPGDRLPPERELAVELGVSRATLAQALVALEMQGRVAVRHGDGAVILDPAERVAAVVAALVGYTEESLESARLPVIAGLLAAATLAPLHARAVPERILAQGAPSKRCGAPFGPPSASIRSSISTSRWSRRVPRSPPMSLPPCQTWLRPSRPGTRPDLCWSRQSDVRA